MTGETSVKSASATDVSSPSSKSEVKIKSLSKSDDKKNTTTTVTNEREKKKQTFITRTVWTLVMIVFFLVVIAGGHSTIVSLVVVAQLLTFKEVIALTAEPARDKNIPWNKSLNWYFLITTIYYLESDVLVGFFQDYIYSNKFLTVLVTHHTFISYFLYVLGFIFFILTLKKGFYKFQFAQLCITHMTLLIVVFQGHLVMENILTGVFWFFLPVALVIVNDIFAYLCGITFGRTQLIEISPKKTVEGFLGAWIFTMLFAVFFTYVLSMSDFFICPAVNLSTNVYNFPTCDPNPVFVSQLYTVPQNFISRYYEVDIITMKPIYLHSLAYATFASLIAPFGGFFASGLKRAFGIKDFGDTIPGHGGVTDRIDCQFLMGSFSYLYYQTFVSTSNMNIANVLQIAVMNLSEPQILQLIKSLLRYLNGVSWLSDGKLETVLQILDA
ncbi:uncharacterized protein KQ657_003475 [Scheffersomyces spartinae]|uniref:Phosphatidate cytidylyltransferase n=1 Tax=Scheffersomyces spartinae TaxID=45513 RepID=A0A9P7V5C8_9ASCO|nr:uncharacterized protein KQ657_003475 [Scheffersomyces spartinae]KAG7191429.1 hypothetical protein KQ657_003475 [Scheffersomyces spartinae]